MYEFSIFQMFLMILLFSVLGAILGYLAMRQGGGSAADLKKIEKLQAEVAELKEHKEEVSDHFKETADLLNDMTHQYKAIYEHMAAGASNLCEKDASAEVVERLQTGLLPKDNLLSSSINKEAGEETDIETQDVKKDA
jgi:hypothetical protein